MATDPYVVNNEMQPVLAAINKGGLDWNTGFNEDPKLITLEKAYSAAYGVWAPSGSGDNAEALAFIKAANDLKNYVEYNYNLVDGAYIKKAGLPAGSGSTPPAAGSNILVLIGVIAAVAVLSFVFKKK
jgi:hypothetical protein